MATVDELAAALRGLGQTYDGGDQFEFTVARGKGEKTLNVTLAGNVFLGTNLFDAPKGGGAEVKVLTAKLDKRGYGQLKPRPGD